jgi:hypothetical protein
MAWKPKGQAQTRLQTLVMTLATACGVALKLHAEKKPNFDRWSDRQFDGMPMKPKKWKKTDDSRTTGTHLVCWNLVLANSRNSYCNFANSALACFRMGMSGSASFQRLKKS